MAGIQLLGLSLVIVVHQITCRRDFVQSTTDHTFKVDLASGTYKVTLINGDNSYINDLIDVYVAVTKRRSLP